MERIPAYEGREPYLFISYAHKDASKVMPVIEALFTDRYRMWYDEGIAPGSEWPRNIEEHLREAAGVLVFVSEDSLASPNCENEVVNAAKDGRPVYQFSLGASHPALAGRPTVEDYRALQELLEERFIGDGVTGYDRGVGTAGRGNFWTAIIAVAAVLIVTLGLGIYGLNTGWFDDLFPGLAVQEAVTQKPQPYAVEGSNIIVRAIAQQTKEEMMDVIPFASEETREILCDAIGFYEWGQETPLTYFNLITCPVEDLWFDEANDELLTYLTYFPQLQCIHIRGGNVTSLEPLLSCAELTTVGLAYEVFPLLIPENAPFVVQFMN